MTTSKPRRILGLTGTRADFGKLKGIFRLFEDHPDYELHVVVTGMHMLQRYGYTLKEVKRENYKNILAFVNQHHEEPMESVLGNTVTQLSRIVREIEPNMVIVHGDRVEAFAGAIVGSISNTRVCHIEGGEVSGTIDDLIRHSVSKLSHIHLVSNAEAMTRLVRMGEAKDSIANIGSPDLDAMMSPDLPSIEEVKAAYEIPFEEYSVSLFHPVTTESEQFRQYADAYVTALVESDQNYVAIYPNNDLGSTYILDALKGVADNPRICIYPSMRFEMFLTLLENARFVIGNSSAGIREAPFYGVPSIDVGTRQFGRSDTSTIVHTDYDSKSILEGIKAVLDMDQLPVTHNFGDGRSLERFGNLLDEGFFWKTKIQKKMAY